MRNSDEFKGKKFIFKDVIIGSNPNQAFVKTEVPMDDGKPVTVRWRVSDKDGVLKIIDIIIGITVRTAPTRSILPR